jgi:hypothetical protein
MSDENRTDFTDLRNFSELTEEQKTRLVAKGIVLVETFLSMTRANPTAMAGLLSCSVDELPRLRAEAEKLVGPGSDLDVPHIPPFGLVPPGERIGDEGEDEPRSDEEPRTGGPTCLD